MNIKLSRYTIVFLAVLMAGPVPFPGSYAQDAGSSGEWSEPGFDRIGILYLDEESRTESNAVTTVGYGKIFSGIWNELALKHGFSVVEASSVRGPESGTAALSVLREGKIDALVVYFLSNSASLSTVEELSNLGVPILVSGYPPDGDPGAPFVGFDGKTDGIAVGKEAGKQLLSRYPGAAARILVVGKTDTRLGKDRAAGFLEGIGSVVSRTSLEGELADPGDAADSLRAIQSMLVKHPEVNVVFGTGEIPTLTVLGALASSPGEDLQKIVTAGFASGDAVLGSGNGGDSVDIVALLPFRAMVEKAVSIIGILVGNPGSTSIEREYLLPSEITVLPTERTLGEYLETNKAGE